MVEVAGKEKNITMEMEYEGRAVAIGEGVLKIGG